MRAAYPRGRRKDGRTEERKRVLRSPAALYYPLAPRGFFVVVFFVALLSFRKPCDCKCVYTVCSFVFFFSLGGELGDVTG